MIKRAIAILLAGILTAGCQMPSLFEGQTQIKQYGRVLAEGQYDSGARAGVWTYYDAAGNVRGQGTYKNGVMQDGLEITFYSNGQKKTEGNWTNGVKDGYWASYFRNGVKKEEGHYLEGKKTGVWREYDPSSFYIIQKVFENDKQVGWRKFELARQGNPF